MTLPVLSLVVGALALLSCTPAPAPVEEVVFLRDAVRHTDGRVEARAWTPGETVGASIAPRLPECAPLFHVELEDRAREAAMGVPPPGAALAFSPDGARLAIGTVGGEVRVVDGWTGAELARRRLPEAAAKRIAWSPDGATLIVGEQSPDALVHALDAATLADRWTVRLADELETSVLPPKDDIYGMFSLPAAYAVSTLPDGRVLVAGAHGWNREDGTRNNRSRLYLFAPDGARLAAWPPEGPLDGVMLNPSVAGDRVLVGVSRSADGPPPPGLPIGGVIALDLPALTPAWTRTFPVLEPHFREVFMWDAVALGDVWSFVGLGDGRAFVLDAVGSVVETLSPGVPVLSQGVPIATGVGFATQSGGRAWFLTTETNIPWGSADPNTRPPTAHPAQNTVHALSLPGTPLWSRPLEMAVAGVSLAPDGAALLIGGANRVTDTRLDLFGAVLLEPSTGEVITTCRTEGPVDFRPAWAPDARRFAVTEAPFQVESAVRGAYRVTVFR